MGQVLVLPPLILPLISGKLIEVTSVERITNEPELWIDRRTFLLAFTKRNTPRTWCLLSHVEGMDEWMTIKGWQDENEALKFYTTWSPKMPGKFNRPKFAGPPRVLPPGWGAF